MSELEKAWDELKRVAIELGVAKDDIDPQVREFFEFRLINASKRYVAALPEEQRKAQTD